MLSCSTWLLEAVCEAGCASAVVCDVVYLLPPLLLPPLLLLKAVLHRLH